MALIKCPECGKEISDKAISCPECGYVIGKTKFCKYCGEKIPEDSVMCVKCGRQVENTSGLNSGITINNAASSSASSTAQSVQDTDKKETTKKEVNKSTALILCIFLGYLGAHKFYEGNIAMGILYLCTVGLFGFGWLIDILVIAAKPNPYYV